jgi:hypothetical protein
MKRIIAITIVMLGAYTVAAQQVPPQPPSGPQLTELQKVKLENIQLKFQGLQVQIQELQKQYSEIAQEVSAQHPGYMLDQAGSLIPAPKPSEAKPKAEVKPALPKK